MAILARKSPHLLANAQARPYRERVTEVPDADRAEQTVPTDPDDEDYGVHLGSQAPRAERGTLINGADTLVRASCNPFFDYQSARIAEHLRAADDRGGGLP